MGETRVHTKPSLQFLMIHSENIKNVSAPSILIAGCGTGQHSLGTASRFSNCHVTAVDLSLAIFMHKGNKNVLPI